MNRSNILKPLVHIAIWLGVIVFPFLFRYHGPGDQIHPPGIGFIIMVVAFNLLIISFYYLNYYILIPRFFIRRKYILYCLCVLAYLAVLMMMAGPGGHGHQMGPHSPDNMFFMHIRMDNTLIFFFIILIISGSIRLVEEQQLQQSHIESVLAEKNKTELAYLKSQVNPHFLFNALNTIYSLTLIDPPAAGEATLKLSDMMRYVMEDSQGHLVPLSSELEHIENYLEFQKLRMNEKIKLDYQIPVSTGTLKIAPLILIPFIENIFKYGVSAHEESPVQVHITLEGNTLHYYSWNNIVTIAGSTRIGGIGMENAKRRLELIYPGRYDLDIKSAVSSYSVSLKINLA